MVGRSHESLHCLSQLSAFCLFRDEEERTSRDQSEFEREKTRESKSKYKNKNERERQSARARTCVCAHTLVKERGCARERAKGREGGCE